MHYAVKLNRERIALFLIAKNADVNARDNKEQTPIHLAAQHGLTDMCRFLLDFNANIKLKDLSGWTVLHHAVNHNHLDTIPLLIKRGADINAEDHQYGRTPLHLAAEKGYAEMVEMLVIRGADMLAMGDTVFSKTPLHIACFHGHTNVVEVLTRKGANVHLLSGLLDETPLHIACTKGYVECAKLLIEAHANVDAIGQQTNGATPLHMAAKYNHWQCCNLLIQSHCSVNLLGKYNVTGTALHTACEVGYVHIVQLLLDHQADVNSFDVNHYTPLHICCQYSHYDLARRLIECGANYKIKALNGKLAIDFVKDPIEKDQLISLCAKMDRLKEHQQRVERQRKLLEDRLLQERQRQEAEAARIIQEGTLQKQRKTEEFRKTLQQICQSSGEVATLYSLAEQHAEEDINILFFSSYTPALALTLTEADNNVPSSSELAVEESKTMTAVTTHSNQREQQQQEEAFRYTGNNALTSASERGYYELVAALLMWPRININHQDFEGNSSLHLAAKQGYRDIVELLLLYNAKIVLLNKQGKAPVNLTSRDTIKELIRNPHWLKQKHRYQNAVMEEIFRRKQTTTTLTVVDEILENTPIADIAVEDIVLKDALQHTETFKAISQVPTRSDTTLPSVLSPQKQIKPLKPNLLSTSSTTLLQTPSTLNLRLTAATTTITTTTNTTHTNMSTSLPKLPFTSPNKSTNLSIHSNTTTLPPIPGPMTVISTHTADTLSQSSLSQQHQLQPIANDNHNHIHNNLLLEINLEEESQDVDLIIDPKKFQTKYGEIPRKFGGCRRDMFHFPKTVLQDNNNQDNNYGYFLDVFVLQGTYIPSSFETTEEWCDVKDFFWLVGAIYQNAFPHSASHNDTRHRHHENHKLELERSYVTELFQQQYHHISLTQQLQLSTSTSTSHLMYILQPEQKCYLVYCLAKTMNDLQRMFTIPSKTLFASLSSATTTATIEAFMTALATAIPSHEHIPNNLMASGVYMLYWFAHKCRDQLTLLTCPISSCNKYLKKNKSVQ